MRRWAAALVCLAIATGSPRTAGQTVDVEITACRAIYEVLRAMQSGARHEVVSRMLDEALDTRPYRVMFAHYNRPWRPNHLPKQVFKRMILSLQFPGEYRSGENDRADMMRDRWLPFYADLGRYDRQLRQLEDADLSTVITQAVGYAQTWLPAEWKIPAFYFPVVPNGGSPAFTIDAAQGYDFFQLSQDHPGVIDLNWFIGTVAHESHHLGMQPSAPREFSAAESLAYHVVTLTVAEGAATEFIRGPPRGCAPPVPSVPFHIFTPALASAWNEHVAHEGELVRHHADLLAQALAGRLTNADLDNELRDYWLSGAVGRAYVLGADMFGAIFAAAGKEAVFAAMRQPWRLFDLYNHALDTRPDLLGGCMPVPPSAAAQALSLGPRASPR